jgi:hypothetical protein
MFVEHGDIVLDRCHLYHYQKYYYTMHSIRCGSP